MTEATRPFVAGIIDFNPKRMTPSEARANAIPPDLVTHVGDWRQYPLNIAKHFPDGISWYQADQPWYFESVMNNKEQRGRLNNADILILSGSGISAHKFEYGSQEYRDSLEKSQEAIRDHLGRGKWIMGICFGGQLAIQAVGGRIGRLPGVITEAGWLDHMLTATGRKDNVFGSLPSYFSAPHFHNDFVEDLPFVGTKIQTASGVITVTKAEILAIRHGYLDKGGLTNIHSPYIMASRIQFDNGATLYQIQPHPEMATGDKANFLVRMNPWLGKEGEMGTEYYQGALQVPTDADFAVAEIIPRFVREAQAHLESQGITFLKATMVRNLLQYLLP